MNLSHKNSQFALPSPPLFTILALNGSLSSGQMMSTKPYLVFFYIQEQKLLDIFLIPFQHSGPKPALVLTVFKGVSLKISSITVLFLIGLFVYLSNYFIYTRVI